jgi:hypothetical protein
VRLFWMRLASVRIIIASQLHTHCTTRSERASVGSRDSPPGCARARRRGIERQADRCAEPGPDSSHRAAGIVSPGAALMVMVMHATCVYSAPSSPPAFVPCLTLGGIPRDQSACACLPASQPASPSYFWGSHSHWVSARPLERPTHWFRRCAVLRTTQGTSERQISRYFRLEAGAVSAGRHHARIQSQPIGRATHDDGRGSRHGPSESLGG